MYDNYILFSEFIGAIEYLFKEYGPIFRTWIITRPVVHIGSAKYAQVSTVHACKTCYMQTYE